MAKRTDREVVKINPSFLAQYAETDTSLTGMEEYVILPFLKIIQAQCQDQELKRRVGEGAVVMSPSNTLIHQPEGDEGFKFVPLFFHTEFQLQSALGDQENPFIMDRSFDPTSELAKKARDKDQRFELYEGDETKPEKSRRHYRYVEALCFSGMIYGDHELSGQQAVLVFSKGEFSNGRKFISAIKMRKERVEIDGQEKPVPVPLWSQVWHLSTSLRTARAGGSPWWGFDFAPAEPNLIDPSESEEFLAMHDSLKKAMEDNKLRVDMSDGSDEDEAFDPDDDDQPM